MTKLEYPAFVQGASRGIGLELVRQLLAGNNGSVVFASCREPHKALSLKELALAHPERLMLLAADATQEATLERAAERIGATTDKLSLIVNVAGVLHGPGFGPEKKLAQVDPEVLRAVFQVNAFGPLVVAKHFHHFLRHRGRTVFASLSARVGSISDNHLGGWYAYRGSKAAQNMFTKTLAIELGRIAPSAIVVGLHPGTVATDLSQPFQRGVPRDKLFTPSKAVQSLLAVIGELSREDSGKVFAWDGAEIPP